MLNKFLVMFFVFSFFVGNKINSSSFVHKIEVEYKIDALDLLEKNSDEYLKNVEKL